MAFWWLVAVTVVLLFVAGAWVEYRQECLRWEARTGKKAGGCGSFFLLIIAVAVLTVLVLVVATWLVVTGRW